MFSLGAWGAISPRYATDLEIFSAVNKTDEDTIRLRITIAGDVQRAERAVRVGDILVCSRLACYRARTSGIAAVESTSRGVAEVVAAAPHRISPPRDSGAHPYTFRMAPLRRQKNPIDARVGDA